MNLKTKKLKEERAIAVEKMQKIVNHAEKKSRDLRGNEKKEWDDLNDSVEDLDAKIETEIRADPLPELTEEQKLGLGFSCGSDFNHSVQNSTETEWKDQEGRAIHVLKPEQRFSECINSDEIRGTSAEGATFGSFIRSMVSNNRTPEESRALSEGTDSAGGFTVPTILSYQLIDLMRKKTSVINAGAQTVGLTSDVTTMARLATDPTASWRAENGNAAESNPTFESVSFTARSLTSLVRVSRELLEDSVNLDASLQNAFSSAMALEIDRVALLGGGTAPEPQGIKGTTGIGQVSMGTNGLALTNYDPILDALQTLADANAGEPTAAIMSPRTMTALAKLKDTTNQPLRKPEAIVLPFMQTTQMPIDETQGTATDASSIMTGNFGELMIGIRSGLQVDILKERYADNLQYGFLVHMRLDIQLAHPASFCEVIGIIP